MTMIKPALMRIWLATALLASFANGGNPELTVVLGKAGDFVVLAGSGISTIPSANITGDIGVSPAVTHTAITGFGALPLDISLAFSTSPQVNGKIYAYDYAAPTPVKMVDSTADMLTAYTDAAGRTIPDSINMGAVAGIDRDIGGLTITPGLYKWDTGGVLISTAVTLDALGDSAAIFIFQIEGDLTVASGQSVLLSGNAQAKNIFWQVKGGAGAIIGTTAHIEGVILAKTAINLLTGSSFNGKLLAQTDVNLDQNNIVDSDLIPPPGETNLTLTIISEHGVGVPLAGPPPEGIVYTNSYGATLTNVISGAEANGGTQYVATGWSMIGNAPVSGVETNMLVESLTNNAVLTWQWNTNYLLNASSVGGGGVTGGTNGFYAAGSTVVVTATPSLGYQFLGWTGDMGGASQR